MQLQGEIQELEIIELLKEFHLEDEITQSKKGANAADILQICRTQNGAEAGKIYYKSKRTKSWSNFCLLTKLFFDQLVDFTDQFSNSLIQELQILESLKSYLSTL